MAYTEHGDYLRTFRVAYTKPIAGSEELEDPTSPPPPCSVFLASKLFMPNRKTDTIADMRSRLEDWVNEMTQGRTQSVLFGLASTRAAFAWHSASARSACMLHASSV